MINQTHQFKIDKGDGDILLAKAEIIEPYEGKVSISILDNRNWTEESILYNILTKEVIRNKIRERK